MKNHLNRKVRLNKLSPIVIAVILLGLFSNSTLTAQVIPNSGYYPVDSLPIEINWQTNKDEIIEYRLNTFGKDDFQEYHSPIWLKDRSFSPNTWENKIYMDYDCIFPVDENQKRGQLYKANILTVRLRNTNTHEILKDSVYVYALYENPFHHFTFFISMDDDDREDMMENFREKVKKKAWLNVFNVNNELEISQTIEVNITGNASRCLANKGLKLKASKKYGPKRFTTSLYGEVDQVKDIKLRAGGGQSDALGYNETIIRTLSSDILQFQPSKNTVSSWYLNGSYWSLTFPQEKIKQREIAKLFDTNKDSIDILEPYALKFLVSKEFPGCAPYIMDFPFTIDNIDYHCNEDAQCYYSLHSDDNSLEEDIEDNIIPINFTMKNGHLPIQMPNGIYQVAGKLKSGNGSRIQEQLTTIKAEIFNNKIQNVEGLRNIIDLDNFLQYISIVNYLNLGDAIYNNVRIASAPNQLPFLIYDDFDRFEDYDYKENNWDFIDLPPNDCLGIVHEIIQKLILNSPEAKERLVLVYQDLMNTLLLPERTTEFVEELRAEIMPYFQYNYDSWGGKINGGLNDSIQQEQILDRLIDFFNKRPNIAIQNLTDRFQAEKQLDSLSTHTLKVIFDSVPNASVSLQLNSLTLKDNFQGKYLPYPALQIGGLDNNKFYIKELPNHTFPFDFNLSQDTTLTLLARNTTQNKKEKKSKLLKIYPNPSNESITVQFIAKKKTIINIYNSQQQFIATYTMSAGDDQKTISTKDLPNGIYFINVSQDRDTMTKTFIKQ